ncbi:MAG: hypothetical protein CMJ32_07850 [Phycisphaerae bacterium]|nr:hypothetical protein [Phycisphaerae bacterium]
MIDKKILVIILLACLLGSALTTVVTILFDSRLAGSMLISCILTGSACILILIAELLHGLKKVRFIGSVLAVTVAIEYVFAMALTWFDVLNGNYLDEMAGTMGLIVPCMLLFMIGFGLLQSNLSRLSGYIGLTGTSLSFLVGVFLIWTDSWMPFTQTEGGIMLAWSMFCSGWLAALCLLPRNWSIPRPTPGQITGCLFTLLFLILFAWLSLKVIILQINQRDLVDIVFKLDLLDLVGISASIAWPFAAYGFIGCLPLSGRFRYARIACIPIFILTSISTTIVIVGLSDWRTANIDALSAFPWWMDMAQRVHIALWVMVACSILATVIVAMIRVIVYTPGQSAFTQSSVRLFCPYCGQKQGVPLGESECRRCGLSIWAWYQYTHCPVCRYDTQGLTADQCPECGFEFTGPVKAPGQGSPVGV